MSYTWKDGLDILKQGHCFLRKEAQKENTDKIEAWYIITVCQKKNRPTFLPSQYRTPKSWNLGKFRGSTAETCAKSSLGLDNAGVPERSITRRACCKGINSLWPSDAIWCHIFGSRLVQVMAAPSHYLNQCCLSISEGCEALYHSPEGNFMRSLRYLSLIWVWKLLTRASPRANELKCKQEEQIVHVPIWIVWSKKGCE